MKPERSTSTTNHHGRWIVEFTELRVRDEHQRTAAASIDRQTLFGILRLWLTVVTPGAVITEPDSGGWTISFIARSQARHFIGCFGGKLMSALPGPDRDQNGRSSSHADVSG
jgi:hypothetical protein